MESYLREKKEAILEDRKNERIVDQSIVVNDIYQDDDQKSCLQQV